MEFFKKRSVAITIAILTVILSTCISSHARLQNECDEVAAMTAQNIRYKGYEHPSIISQLDNLRQDVNVIISCCDETLDLRQLKEDNEDLLSAMKYSPDSASYLYYCYEQVLNDYNALCVQAESAELNDTQQRAFELMANELPGIQRTISEAGYNEKVTELRSDLGRYPAKLFVDLTGVSLPEYFR